MKKAIDIVLLPPDDIMDVCIEVNKAGTRDDGSIVELNKTNRLPHITLMMATVEEEDLSQIEESLENITTNTKPIEIELTEIPEGYEGLRAKKTTELKKLHESIVKVTEQFNTFDADLDSVFPEDRGIMEQKYLDYINNFSTKASFENFDPHITVHSRNLGDRTLPIKFTTNRLAICHLGRLCACRKIFWETNLT